MVIVNSQARMEKRLARLENQIEELNNLRDKLILDPKSSYEFDSGDGRVGTHNRSLGEVTRQIQILEAELKSVIERATGGSVVNVRWRI